MAVKASIAIYNSQTVYAVVYQIYLPKMRFTWVTTLPVPNHNVTNTNTTLRTMMSIPESMNLGAKIFHTIKWRRKWAANKSDSNDTTIW